MKYLSFLRSSLNRKLRKENIGETVITGMGILAGTLGLVGIVTLATLGILRTRPKLLSTKPNYVASSRIEIMSEDLDNTDCEGLPETYLRIDRNNIHRYLIIEKKGRFQIVPYEFKPAQVIPLTTQPSLLPYQLNPERE